MLQPANNKPDFLASEKSGFFRYIAAIFYDTMLIIALFFLATAILLPFNGGEAIESPILFPLYLLSISFLFLAWFWRHGGQTLGMQAWGLYLISDNQARISWYQAAIRYFTASISWLACCLGILWYFWHKDNKTWQDIQSKSSIVYIPKKK